MGDNGMSNSVSSCNSSTPTMESSNSNDAFQENREESDGSDCTAGQQPTTNDGKDPERLECAVCLLTCIHPVQLPCNHIFCFLCMKGVANQSKRCAMCRKEVPPDFLEHPQLVHTSDLDLSSGFEDGYQWYYEGHNGWWQYDQRTSQELEVAYKSGDRTCELLIAGFLYVIDFDSMVQLRRNDPSRRRRIKRDLATIPKKGIAGLRVQRQLTPDVGSCALDSTAGFDRDNAEGDEGAEEDQGPSTSGLLPRTVSGLSGGTLQHRAKSPSPVPVPPNNTPQTPHTPSADSGTSSPTLASNYSLQDIVCDIQTLRLQDNDDESGREPSAMMDRQWNGVTMSDDEQV